MARLPEPDETRLPAGPRRDLVLALREAYRAAGSPSFRRIEAAVADNDGYDDTVSRQSISLLLGGTFIPRWSKIDCLVRQLATTSNPRRDPDAQAARFLLLWNALDHPHTAQPGNAAVTQVDVPDHPPEPSPLPAAVYRQAGRYDDGSQVLPDGGLAQVDQAITRLTTGEYQRGWAAGLQFVEALPVWELLEDLAGYDLKIEEWITGHRESWRARMSASGRGEADLPN
jgi:hypothetical protein